MTRTGYSNIMDVSANPRETEISTEERKARSDLALAYRLFDWLGLTHLIPSPSEADSRRGSQRG